MDLMCLIYTLIAILASLKYLTLATDKLKNNGFQADETLAVTKISKKITAIKTEKKIANSHEPDGLLTEPSVDEPFKKKDKKKPSDKLTLSSEKDMVKALPKTVKKAAKPAAQTKISVQKEKKITAGKVVKKRIDKMKGTLQITFQLKFHTQFGQNLYITGNHEIFGSDDIDKALPLQYYNDELWTLILNWNDTEIPDANITYNYILRNADGTISYDWGRDKKINPSLFRTAKVLIKDSWNHAGYFENAFYTEPFQHVLLKGNRTEVKTVTPKPVTHIIKVKTPLLAKGQTLCICGSGTTLNEWATEKPLLMNREEGDDCYSLKLNLTNEPFPLTYKYGVYDIENTKFIRYEGGKNRVLYDTVEKNKLTVVNDGFAVLPNTTWKGAGIAIPVFSLRSENSFGTGEFTDLKLLVDWSKKLGLKLIQILPINDTTATHTWVDSYPYAAISAFALHPMYLNLGKVVTKENQSALDQLEEERKRLNELDAVDYDAVMKLKLGFIKQIYPSQKASTFNSKGYKEYFDKNKHWLVPYSVFCYLRDEYGTSDFNQWPAYANYNAEEIALLTAEDAASFDNIAINYFIQYHLHLQLKEATEYAHTNGIIVKGDIAIGVYRFGADAWQSPDLYHLNMQAGAPPDDFAVKGQNWGFPTYNWQRMRENGFAWWKQRFEQMSYYFDAFRIDHILGFFRIWSIPMHAVEGIMGTFVPAIPVHINEFNSRNIWFDYHRYTKPFINDTVLWDVFGNDNEYVKNTFLNYNGFSTYTLKPEFNTQRKVEQHLALQNDDAFTKKIKQGLFDLISNVILFEAEGSQGQQFHFRFAMDTTSSFKNLERNTQRQLKELYINYFFRRQDGFWMKEALQKLPALKRVTNMLVCGEDLGLVPACVPDIMRQLGLLSLEIQRMPKDPKKEFFHPNDAPYLSVVTPSTHDLSTIRGWWEEDKNRIQKFYNCELGQWGDAPFYCEAWINKAIVVQHLFSPAMWSIFQLQDILGIDEKIRRVNPNDERINIPANSKHYWKNRMHLSLENLLEQQAFNDELSGYIKTGGR